MPKTIDYYDYWNKQRKQSRLAQREKISLKLISNIVNKDNIFLDAGCGHGGFLLVLKKLFPDLILKGLEFSRQETNQAKSNKLDVKQADLNKPIKLKKASIDIVYAGEVLEHLYDPDLFLSECNRILKQNGYLIITTPNLCAWYNRIFMVLGIQPLFLEPSTKSKLVGAGILKKFKKESQPVGHIRIFTYPALKDLLKMNGFEIIKTQSAIFDEGLPKILLPLDKIFTFYPRLGSHLVILAKKI